MPLGKWARAACLAGAVATVAALAACGNSGSQNRAAAEVDAAGAKTADAVDKLADAAGKDLHMAADKAKPGLDRAGHELKTGADKLALAAGQAADRASDGLEKVGNKAEQHADAHSSR